jgi:hypothetical protein
MMRSISRVTPFGLTEWLRWHGIRAARAFSEATIIPLHYEGWAHFSESREVISRAFDAAGINGRVRWMELGTTVAVP